MWRFGCEKLQLFQTKLATTTSEEGRGAWGWRRDCCPAAFPLTLAGAPQLKLYQTRACACYKLCKIWQQGRAAEFQLEALLSELNCYNFWTGLSQWLEGWITREVERGEIIYSEWVAITLSKQKKASQCRVQTIWYNLISFFTTSLRLLLFQNLVGSSCWK